jgi:hypothetical protein
VDRPWLRDGFKHRDLKDWAMEHRGELVRAALVMISAWRAAGSPPFKGKRLGSYERWSDVIGGILDVAGIPGFLGNILNVYESADQAGNAHRSFVAGWWDQHQNAEVGVSDLYQIAFDTEGIDLGSGSVQSQKSKLGFVLRKLKDRVFGEIRVTKVEGQRNNANLWRLEKVA